jgi:hypothetical protein
MPKKSLLVVMIAVSLLFPVSAEAQCAMCRAALESAEDQSQAEGINNGIVYLMSIPYILFGIAVALYFRRFRKKPVSTAKS